MQHVPKQLIGRILRSVNHAFASHEELVSESRLGALHFLSNNLKGELKLPASSSHPLKRPLFKALLTLSSMRTQGVALACLGAKRVETDEWLFLYGIRATVIPLVGHQLA